MVGGINIHWSNMDETTFRTGLSGSCMNMSDDKKQVTNKLTFKLKRASLPYEHISPHTAMDYHVLLPQLAREMAEWKWSMTCRWSDSILPLASFDRTPKEPWPFQPQENQGSNHHDAIFPQLSSRRETKIHGRHSRTRHVVVVRSLKPGERRSNGPRAVWPVGSFPGR